MASYAKRIFKGTLVVFLAAILSGFVGYITRIVLARNLSTYEYGLLFAVMNFVFLFDLFKDLGLGNALVRYIPHFLHKKKYDKIKAAITYTFLIRFISALIFVIVVFLLSNWLSVKFFKSSDSLIILRMFLLVFLLSVFTEHLKSIFQGFQSMKNYSLVEFFRKFFTFVLILMFFKLGFGLIGAVYAYVLTTVIVPVVMYPVFIKKFNLFSYKMGFSKDLMKKLVFFGIPTVLAYLGASFISYMDTIFITYFRNLEEVAMYNVALPTAMFLYYLGNSLLVVMFPLASELWVSGKKKKLAHWLNLLQKYSFIVVIPAIIGLIPFSKLLISVFFGASYENAAIALQILVVGVLFYILADLNLIVLSGVGKPKSFAKVIFLAAIINFIANLALVPVYGYIGAAITTSFSYVCALVLSLRDARKYINMKFEWLNIIKISFCGFIAIISVYLIKSVLSLNVFIEMIICFLIALLIYVLLLFALKIISVNEIRNLKNSILKSEK